MNEIVIEAAQVARKEREHYEKLFLFVYTSIRQKHEVTLHHEDGWRATKQFMKCCNLH